MKLMDSCRRFMANDKAIIVYCMQLSQQDSIKD